MITNLEPGFGPPYDFSLAVYPNPPSHDFLTWLVIAKMAQRQHPGWQAPLRVRFALMGGMLGKYDWDCHSLASDYVPPRLDLPRSYSDAMIANVLRPAIAMMGAIEDEAIDLVTPLPRGILAGYVEYDYHCAAIVDAARAGAEVPQWRPPQWAFEEVDRFLQGARPIVITLREAERQPERNSNILEWFKFSVDIGKKYLVLFVRDTAKSTEPFEEYWCWQAPSADAYIRAALYQRAGLNCFVGNGPFDWAKYSAAPYLMFKGLVPELPDWEHGQAYGWLVQDHMRVGEQWPWAKSNQRMTWNTDSYENIMAVFEEVEDLI